MNIKLISKNKNMLPKYILKPKSDRNESKDKPPLIDKPYKIPFQNEILRNNFSLVNSYNENRERFNFDIFQNTFLHSNSIKKDEFKNPYKTILNQKINKNSQKSQKKDRKTKLRLLLIDEEHKNNISLIKNKNSLKNFDNYNSNDVNKGILNFQSIYERMLNNQKISSMKIKLKKKHLDNSFENDDNDNYIIRSIRNKY
jgi:hypothetical protein